MPIFDEIDTPLPDLYARFPTTWTIGSGVLSGFFFLYGIFTPKLTIPIVTVPPGVTVAYTVILKPLIILGAPLLFSFCLIFLEERFLGSRDEDMADSITEISEEHGFQTVVVSCGDMHLDRLPELLENRGWDVEIHESNHRRASKLWR